MRSTRRDRIRCVISACQVVKTMWATPTYHPQSFSGCQNNSCMGKTLCCILGEPTAHETSLERGWTKQVCKECVLVGSPHIISCPPINMMTAIYERGAVIACGAAGFFCHCCFMDSSPALKKAPPPVLGRGSSGTTRQAPKI